MKLARWFAGLLSIWALICGLASAQTSAADRLRANLAAAQQAGTTFDRPLYLKSTESPDRLQGDVYAVIDQPYAAVRQALAKPERWCAILILHLNTKYCRADQRAGRAAIDMGVGRRFDQPLSEVYWLNFGYSVAASTPEYLQVVMQAPSGPMSTHDYRIEVEAAPLTDTKSVLHLTYAYSYGFAGRLAMQSYLATLGSARVGFSVTGKDDAGKPIYIGGVRGVIERNTMRYYLAIESYLAAQSLPPADQMAASLKSWFDATERYARQLHEIDRDDYLAMKRHELTRQATELPPDRSS